MGKWKELVMPIIANASSTYICCLFCLFLWRSCSYFSLFWNNFYNIDKKHGWKYSQFLCFFSFVVGLRMKTGCSGSLGRYLQVWLPFMGLHIHLKSHGMCLVWVTIRALISRKLRMQLLYITTGTWNPG